MTAVLETQTAEAAQVRAAQRGDRAAFGALYQHYGRVIHGVLLSRVSYADAEDLTQDVFLKAMERLPSLREPEAFPGWLFAIARRMATDHARSQKVTCDPECLVSPRSQPDGEAFGILRVVAQLPEAYRDPLILRLVEGMTGPEIARRTGMTPDSVRVNLCRGMKMLRGQLEEQSQK